MASYREKQGGGWASVLKSMDAFPKQREEAAEFFHRSVSGGIITLAASLIMTILFFSELGLFVRVRTVNELFVDTSRGETMQIHVSAPRGMKISSLTRVRITATNKLKTPFMILTRSFSRLHAV